VTAYDQQQIATLPQIPGYLFKAGHTVMTVMPTSHGTAVVLLPDQPNRVIVAHFDLAWQLKREPMMLDQITTPHRRADELLVLSPLDFVFSSLC
jgi:hypothetical protein